jgi:hypothetical protein
MTRRVYIVGAGFSAGLGFPVTADLLSLALARMPADQQRLLKRILEFHFPDFRPNDVRTYPNIEDVLTRIRINIDLFDATRRWEGRLKIAHLEAAERDLLYVLVQWFHQIRTEIRDPSPEWLETFVRKVKEEQATIISFNWDLVLDVLLSDKAPGQAFYGMGLRVKKAIYLLKPHGSLNWYGHEYAQHFSPDSASLLWKPTRPEHERFDSVWLFRHFRAPITKVPGRQYAPKIVPPTYLKSFEHPFFREIFRLAVERMGEAKEVFFLGFSMPQYDYHAEFLLRCGFHAQRDGLIVRAKRRTRAIGPARVIVVNPDDKAAERVRRVLGVECEHEKMSVSTWIRSSKLH